MNNKEVKEIYKTEYIDKELPTIFFKDDKRNGLSDIRSTIITVSDKTSESALNTFKKIKDLIK